MKGILEENLFVGNGSDEVFDLVFCVFCCLGRDKVVICLFMYGMYEVFVVINDVEFVKVLLIEFF